MFRQPHVSGWATGPLRKGFVGFGILSNVLGLFATNLSAETAHHRQLRGARGGEVFADKHDIIHKYKRTRNRKTRRHEDK